MKKRQAIVESTTAPNDSMGFDKATRLELADKADSIGLIFNKDISPLDEFPKHSSTGFQKIVNLISLSMDNKTDPVADNKTDPPPALSLS